MSELAAPADELLDDLDSCSLQLLWVLRRDATRTFGPLGFRTMRALLLDFVGRGYTKPKDLAERLGTVAPAVSALITELEERGLLVRQSDPGDGRRVQLSLTEDGEETLRVLRRAWRQTGQKRFDTFSEEELEVFTRLCHKLLDG